MRLPRSVRDADVAGKRVLVRADLNVPARGREGRRRHAHPRLAADAPAAARARTQPRCIVCSHLGRPKGPDPAFSMAPVEARLRELLGATTACACSRTRASTRARPRTTRSFATRARRRQPISTSTTRSARRTARTRRRRASRTCCRPTPGCCCARARGARAAARRGRAPVRRRRRRREGRGQDRRAALLAQRADVVLVGGKMAEEIRVSTRSTFEVELPQRRRRRVAFEPDAESKVVAADEVPEGWLGLDIGPETREASRRGSRRRRRSSGTARWASSSGRASPRARSRSPRRSPTRTRYTVVGGGDSVRAIEEAGLADRIVVGLDRRRRLARAARGQGTARRRGDSGRID